MKNMFILPFKYSLIPKVVDSDVDMQLNIIIKAKRPTRLRLDITKLVLLVLLSNQIWCYFSVVLDSIDWQIKLKGFLLITQHTDNAF